MCKHEEIQYEKSRPNTEPLTLANKLEIDLVTLVQVGATESEGSDFLRFVAINPYVRGLHLGKVGGQASGSFLLEIGNTAR